MQDSFETFTKKLIEFYGDRLADPELYPKTFEYQVKIMVYILKK